MVNLGEPARIHILQSDWAKTNFQIISHLNNATLTVENLVKIKQLNFTVINSMNSIFDFTIKLSLNRRSRFG